MTEMSRSPHAHTACTVNAVRGRTRGIHRVHVSAFANNNEETRRGDEAKEREGERTSEIFSPDPATSRHDAYRNCR